jgi:hypothetical protein
MQPAEEASQLHADELVKNDCSLTHVRRAGSSFCCSLRGCTGVTESGCFNISSLGLTLYCLGDASGPNTPSQPYNQQVPTDM